MYILKANPRSFVVVQQNGDLIITPDHTKATQYEAIGDAMKAASEVNKSLGVNIFKVKSI